MSNNSILHREKARVYNSLYYPVMFVAILWIIAIADYFLPGSFARFGVYPREVHGLTGIITYPLIHGDFQHLFSNSVPLIVLGFIVFHSYYKIVHKIIPFVYIMSGVLVWLFARSSYHIGASGLVYGLAFFIFFSGVFRKNIKAIALALLVVFFYGGIVWGLLPLKPGVSWEGHLAGAVVGAMCAWYYRKMDPPRPYPWENEEEEDAENVVGSPFWVSPSKTQTDSWDIPIKDDIKNEDSGFGF